LYFSKYIFIGIQKPKDAIEFSKLMNYGMKISGLNLSIFSIKPIKIEFDKIEENETFQAILRLAPVDFGMQKCA